MLKNYKKMAIISRRLRIKEILSRWKKGRMIAKVNRKNNSFNKIYKKIMDREVYLIHNLKKKILKKIQKIFRKKKK